MNKFKKGILSIVDDPATFKFYFKKGIEWIMQQSKRSEIIKFQNNNIKKAYKENTENLIVFLVPGWDGVNGGVMSINSIAKVSLEYRNIHNSDVMLATLPGHQLFNKYTGFESPFDIYRFEQILSYFVNIEKLILHIPENFVIDFIKSISSQDREKLKLIKQLQINVMNQNVWYMPGREEFEKLYEFTSDVTISIAHKKYCTKELRDKYTSSVHLFSTSNLTKYKYKKYKQKENILLTSIDNHPLKETILEKIHKAYPNLKIKQIENMSYEEYKSWISRAKWMITFGEGLDGYFVESIRSGAIAFAVYNPEFFSERFENLPNIYESYNEMMAKIVQDIKLLDNEQHFKELNDQLIQLDKIEYNDDEYKENIKRFYEKKYDFPYLGEELVKKRRKALLEREPLVSIVLATYNGEKYLKKQLKSLQNLTYKNVELIISDDNSTDSTLKILKEFLENYKNPYKLLKNRKKPGVNGNFETALEQASGEYIALCDQDDIWLEDKIELLLEHIDDYDMIHSTMTLINEKDEIHPNKNLRLEYEQDHSDKVTFVDFIGTGWVLGCASLIKRETVQKALPFPEGIFLHDWWMTMLAIKEGNGIKFLNKPTLKYRQHSNNTAQSIYANVKWYKNKVNFNLLLERHFNHSLTKYERMVLRNNTNYCISKYFLVNDYQGNYKDVDEFLLNNNDLLNRKFLNKFVEIVVEDTLLSYGINPHGNQGPVKIKTFTKNYLKQKIHNPENTVEKSFSKLYFTVCKPLLVSPYRKIKGNK